MFIAAGNAFRLNFADLPNAPATDYLPVVDPDSASNFFLQAIALTKRIVTFIKFSISTFDATWRAGHAAVMISFPQGIRADTNDLGGRYYRKV